MKADWGKSSTESAYYCTFLNLIETEEKDFSCIRKSYQELNGCSMLVTGRLVYWLTGISASEEPAVSIFR
jgi:hypothetical protein